VEDRRTIKVRRRGQTKGKEEVQKFKGGKVDGVRVFRGKGKSGDVCK